MINNPIKESYTHLKALAHKDSTLFDLFGFIQKQTQIYFKKQDRDLSLSEDKHINMRVLKKGRMGTSWTKDFSKQGLEDCYQKAKEALKWTDRDEAGTLSQNQNYESLEQFYHSGFKKISVEEKLEKAKQIQQSCINTDSRVEPTYCYLSDQDRLSFFANNKGSLGLFRSSYVLGGSICLAQDKNSRSQGIFHEQGRDHSLIDWKKIGRESAQIALKKLFYEIPKTKKYPVLFKAGQASGSLLNFLVAMMSAKRVFDGLSLLKKSLNKKLFSEKLFIYDDPFVSWGPNAEVFDAEGYPAEKTPLVKKGVLNNYLSSSFYAKSLAIPHTKKAVWENDILQNSPSNVIMAEGDSSFEEIVSQEDQLIVIDQLKGLHAGYNPISGDFSLNSEGFLWQSGKKKALSEFTVSGNILKVFANITKIAKDSEVESGVRSPSFLVPELMIAGK